MAPDDHARLTPDKPAAVMGGSGASLSFGQLAERSVQLAHAMRAAGLKARDHVAFMLENRLEVFEVVWAAQRLGLYYTPINWHLQPGEVAHIVRDSGARWLFTSKALAALADASTLERVVRVDDGHDALLAAQPATPPADQREGQPMYYSSGTTGQPKGIKRALPLDPYGTTPGWEQFIADPHGFDAETVYLCPAPLYHAAPLGWVMAIQRRGGTVIVMEKFDPAQALALIERHRVTHVQMVPTHFVQMLKLPAAERLRHDLSSLRMAVHAAAPCPVEVKERMLDWWGPIIHEYYAFSEGTGFARITPQEWRTHRGSVGRPTMGTVRILGEDGREMRTGETGVVWIEGGYDFEYHNDPDKTRAAHDAQGRTTAGDMGHVDSDGYLYLTDRVSNMIISGGVNIYPQEVENLLVTHEKVSDAAVIGVPDADYGEAVKAVVVAAPGVPRDEALAAELIAFCRSRIAHFKCPKSVDFVDDLPRLPTGKLLKRRLRERYPTTT